ncbi:MAG: PQQ-dependent sugar dehydrogenase [Chloroflexi bacterium]|nr:PQQ-dependent sugar dehydrogenase [Chloroflexota bacterium]
MSRVFVALALVLSACGGIAPTTPPSVVPSAASAAPSEDPAVPADPTAGVTAAATSVPSVGSDGPLGLVLVADHIDLPTALADAGDQRLFVTEQAGRVRVIANGMLQPDPVLDLTDRVLNDGERGLLGIALHPRFGRNGRYFLTYSNLDGDTELREFDVGGPVDAEGTLLLEAPKETVNHQAGALAFGPDGYLYASLGDDSRQGFDRADPASINGTILRLDIDTTSGGYAIPPDNPFVDGGGRPEVWDYGLRNPWRFSFDPLTGDLYIGDVGPTNVEEIDRHPAGTPGGLDFGWIATVGDSCREPGCDTAGITWPLVTYGHGEGDCGVIGGYVIRADQARQGRYLYGDLCSGRIWSLAAGEPGDPVLEIDSGLRLSSFGIDSAGTIYVLVHYRNGSVYRVTG